MHLFLSGGGLPIYEQIRTQIQTQIVCGQLQAGEALPSIRTLAKELRVSVITTKRAYEELEKDGFLEIIPGKGTFVSVKDVQTIRKDYIEKINWHFQRAAELARGCQLSLAQLQDLLEKQYEEESTCPMP